MFSLRPEWQEMMIVSGPGGSFTIPRGAVHNGVNVGCVPARLLITYLLDKGAPQRTDAPDPAVH